MGEIAPGALVAFRNGRLGKVVSVLCGRRDCALRWLDTGAYSTVSIARLTYLGEAEKSPDYGGSHGFKTGDLVRYEGLVWRIDRLLDHGTGDRFEDVAVALLRPGRRPYRPRLKYIERLDVVSMLATLAEEL